MKRLPGKEVIFFHCIIHQEIICKRVLKLKHVISVVTNVVNFIRERALNHKQFVRFLKEIECDFTDIFYNTDIRWLSLAKVLKRFIFYWIKLLTHYMLKTSKINFEN